MAGLRRHPVRPVLNKQLEQRFAMGVMLADFVLEVELLADIGEVSPNGGVV